MRNRPSLLPALWLIVVALWLFVFIEHGRMLGGVQYFVHMGRGPAAAAELSIIGLSGALAWLVWSRSKIVKHASLAVAGIAGLFALGFVLPIPVIRAFNPYVFPFGLFGIVVPIATAFYALVASSIPTQGASSDQLSGQTSWTCRACGEQHEPKITSCTSCKTNRVSVLAK